MASGDNQSVLRLGIHQIVKKLRNFFFEILLIEVSIIIYKNLSIFENLIPGILKMHWK